jgi:hypothetical protein
MEIREGLDDAAAARHARFGTLPARIACTDMVEEKPASPANGTGDGCYAEGRWMEFNCLAVDLGR